MIRKLLELAVVEALRIGEAYVSKRESSRGIDWNGIDVDWYAGLLARKEAARRAAYSADPMAHHNALVELYDWIDGWRR